MKKRFNVNQFDRTEDAIGYKIGKDVSDLPAAIYKYIVFKGELPDQWEVHRFAGGELPSPIVIDPVGGKYALEEHDVKRLLKRQTEWRALSSTPFVGICRSGKIKIAARMELCTPPGGYTFIQNAPLVELLDILEDADATSYRSVASGWFGLDIVGGCFDT